MLSFLATLLSLPLPGILSRQRLHIQRESGLVFSFDIWGCNETKEHARHAGSLVLADMPACPLSADGNISNSFDLCFYIAVAFDKTGQNAL
jgi:hypothetical protein